MLSQSIASSSSSPLTSAPPTANLMSPSFTKPWVLHSPTQRDARVDWTARRLRT
jgi:hypothetical protein